MSAISWQRYAGQCHVAHSGAPLLADTYHVCVYQAPLMTPATRRCWAQAEEESKNRDDQMEKLQNWLTVIQNGIKGRVKSVKDKKFFNTVRIVWLRVLAST